MQAVDQLGAYHGLFLAGAMLLEGVGIPLPTELALLAAGALAAGGRVNAAAALVVPPACLVAGDAMWFFLGRRFGPGILRTVCRISLERDTCVRKTQDAFARRGLRVLLVSRFVPGLSSLAAPMAGATGTRYPRFLRYELVGAALYTWAYTAVGYVFAGEIDRVASVVGGAGGRLAAVAAAVVAAYAGYKYLARRWLLGKAESLAVQAADVHRRRLAQPALLIVDLRGPADLAAAPYRIPGAKAWAEAELMGAVAALPPETPIVLFCACPHQASSTRTALALHRRGFLDARPLRDGLDGWRAAGLPVEPWPPQEGGAAGEASSGPNPAT